MVFKVTLSNISLGAKLNEVIKSLDNNISTHNTIITVKDEVSLDEFVTSTYLELKIIDRLNSKIKTGDYKCEP